MRKYKGVIAVGLALAYVAAPFSMLAADKKAPKPYPLETCAVSDEKLGEMGEPYVFVHQGQEVKLCCKSCQKDFKKNTAKIMKKIDAAAKKKAS
jgi:hypothetical protein